MCYSSIDSYKFSFGVLLSRTERPYLVTTPQYDKYLKTLSGNRRSVIIETNAMPSGILNRHEQIIEIQEGLNRSGLIGLSQEELDNLQGLAFRYLFRLDENLLKELELSKKTLGLDSSPYVALHLRTGFVGAKYTEKTSKWDRDASIWESALKCALNTADKHLGNDSLVFLATDSVEVKKLATSKHGTRIRTLQNPIIHVNRIHLSKPSETTKKGVLTAWVEHLLLAQGEFLLRGNSGFSWTAGQVCGLVGNNRTLSIHKDCMQH